MNNSFQPTGEIRVARTLWRQRGSLVADASSAIQRMQKVLIEMNIQLSSVLSDISGVSGMSIIAAMLEGERDPWTLAALVQPEVKASPQQIAQSLEGNWRKELLFVLRQEVELYRTYQEKIRDCDLQLRDHLQSFGSAVDLEAQPIGPRPPGKKASKNAPLFDLRTELYRITGIDWAQVRHPPRSGWLDELGRLKDGRSLGLGVARCAPYWVVQNCPAAPSAVSCSRMYVRTCSSSNPTVDTA